MSRYPVVSIHARAQEKKSRCAREEKILMREARTAGVLAAFREVLLDVKADVPIAEVRNVFIDFRRKAIRKWLFPSFFDRIIYQCGSVSVRRVVCHETICAVESSDGIICAFFALRDGGGDAFRGQMHTVHTRRSHTQMIKTRHGAYVSQKGQFSLFMGSVRTPGEFGIGTLYSPK